MSLLSGLSANFKMEGNSTNTQGTGNGTDTSITYSTANGKIGQGAGFGTLITIASIANIFIDGVSFTIAGWYSSASTTNYREICKYMNNGNTQSNLDLYFTGGGTPHKLECFTQNTGGTAFICTSVNSYDNGAFHFVVVSYDNATKVLTLDIDNGAERINSSALTGNKNTTVGLANWGQNESATNQFTGKMDEIAVWSRALTVGEISQLYNGGNGLSMPVAGATNIFNQI